MSIDRASVNLKRNLPVLLVTIALVAVAAGAACSASTNNADDNGTTDASTGTDAKVDDAGATSDSATQDAGPTLSSGLIGLWNFEETAPGTAGGTDFADQSGNGNNGVATSADGGVTFGATGLIGKAVELNGTSSAVSIPDTSSLHAANITISVWFNATVLPTSTVATLVTKPQLPAPWTYPYLSWLLRVNAADYVEGDVGSTGLYSGAPGTVVPSLATGTWYQAVLTYDGTLITTYLDNTLLGSAAFGLADGGIAYSDQPLLIGASNGAATVGGGEFFTGSIDQVAIWGRVLSTAELTALYNGGNGTTLP